MSHKVKIAARLRPRVGAEIEDDSIQMMHSEEGPPCVCVVNPKDPGQYFNFPFSSCYNQSATQEQIFENDVRPLIDVAFDGVTVTIFAYGVTSSGKTHTMQGTKADPGVIPRVVEALVAKKLTMQRGEVALAFSYMEIYRDEVYDLSVNRETAPKLPVRENDTGQVFVANLSSTPFESFNEFEVLYSRANKRRSVGATNLNRASSRSHAVLSIEIALAADEKILTGKINLVDLAGSENNKLTGNDAARMAESSSINKSLSVLGQVVHALNQGASRIPYRNSKLTRILQDALGGSSVGLLICNLAPGLKFRQDTLNTLNFAVRTKNVENKPVINERDNRPAPKRHFAAIQAPPPKMAPAIVTAAVAGPSRQSIAGSSRMPRPSMGALTRPALPSRGMSDVNRKKGIIHSFLNNQGPRGSLMPLSESDIDERIAKAVAAEVAKRLAEKEQEKLNEEEEERSIEQELSRTEDPSEPQLAEDRPIPSGILTPLLKRHKDLDEELRQRLQDLEKKFENEHSNKEMQLVDVLSPVSRKKTGRAYVALARAHSEKGNLQVALDLYRKAETYVPENVKLKERIIEIEYAVKSGQEFKPSPKRADKPKKTRARKRSKTAKSLVNEVDSQADGMQNDNDDDAGANVVIHKGKKQRADFGSELTNKRAVEEDDVSLQTPAKRQRRDGQRHEATGNEDLEPPIPVKKGKRKLIARS